MTELWCDVSFWNGLVDFNKMKAAGAKGVIIRLGSINSATGECYEDYEFRRNVVEAPKVFGPRVGGYFFLRPVFDASRQSGFVIKLLGEFPAIRFLVDDVEVAGPAMTAKLFNWSIAEFFKSPKKSPLYTSPHAWNDLLTGDKSWGSIYPLHQAQWDVAAPQLIAPWSAGDRKLWQYSANGNHLGSTYGNGLAYNVETGRHELQPTVNMDLNLVDEAWAAEVCAVEYELPQIVKVIRNCVIYATPNGKVVSVAPDGLDLHPSEKVKDFLGRDWYRVGSSQWVLVSNTVILE